MVTYSDTITLQAFKEYRAGYLPNPGGWLDQPMKFSALVGMVEGITIRLERMKEDGKSGS